MKIEIKHKTTGEVIVSGDYPSPAEAASQNKHNLPGADLSRAYLPGADLSRAYLPGADLSRANLSDANLFRASLSDANLFRANLSGANLSGADLSRANLSGADLSHANLSGANMSGANLSGANLSRANLSGAVLTGAYLPGANMSGANLSGANLFRANLSRANLSGADLHGANLFGANLDLENTDTKLAIQRTRILPEGEIIGWKKLAYGHIAKLRIPQEAKRSHAFSRKCRAEFAIVEGIYDHNGKQVSRGGSSWDYNFKYVVNERVSPVQWDPDWTKECTGGIHFYITREEAEAHQ